MRAIIGILMMAAGVAFALYAGIWWAFIGGIVDVIHAVSAPQLVAMDVALGIAKIVFANVIGVLSFIVAVFPGYAVFLNAE